VRVYTVEQVANALTDPGTGTVTLSKESVIAQCITDGGCPDDHYLPEYELGRGGGRSIIVTVLARSAKATYQWDLKDIRRHSEDFLPGSFAAWRANVEVTGPSRLRARVIRLRQAMPPPTTTVGQITPPAEDVDVSGPAVFLDLNAPDAPHERIYLPDQVTRALRRVVPTAPAVRTLKSTCGKERPCTYAEFDDIGHTYGRGFLIWMSGSSAVAERSRARSAEALREGEDGMPGDIVVRVANVELEGARKLILRLAELLRETPPSVPLNRIIAPRRDGGPVRIRADHHP